MILLALLAAASPVAAKVDAIAAKAGLAGEVLIAKGDTVLVERAYGTVAPTGGKRHRIGARWRLASITKQVTAVGVMRMVERGERSLDAPLSSFAALPGANADTAVTLRMLLTHHSGLANPDETPHGADEFPAFYRASAPDMGYCLSKAGVPNAPFSYNNCDYILAGATIEQGEAGDGELDNALIPGAFARGAEKGVPGYVKGKPESDFSLATFGQAGGLIGTARDVLRFDRDLMTGRLLGPAALKELWTPEGKGSYQALGQWVFPGKLAGCAAPKRIVQRDGEIGGVQTRNFILPDENIVVIVFTNRSSDDFALGEVWQGKGFTFDLLSAAACP